MTSYVIWGPPPRYKANQNLTQSLWGPTKIPPNLHVTHKNGTQSMCSPKFNSICKRDPPKFNLRIGHTKIQPNLHRIHQNSTKFMWGPPKFTTIYMGPTKTQFNLQRICQKSIHLYETEKRNQICIGQIKNQRNLCRTHQNPTQPLKGH